MTQRISFCTQDSNDAQKIDMRISPRRSQKRILLRGSQDPLLQENDLLHALESGHVVPWYQTQHFITDSHLSGFEALARWEHPEYGLIRPDRFISLAEQASSPTLCMQLGLSMLDQALFQMSKWLRQEEISSTTTMGVNVSQRQLVDSAFPYQVADIARKHGIQPSRVDLEITEGIETSEVMLNNLFQLKEEGFRLAIDDFGQGFAGIQRLRELPADVLKIDREIADGLIAGGKDAILAKSLFEMARGMGLRVVTEGVSSIQHLCCLRRIGGDIAQGYLFSEAAGAETILNTSKVVRLDLQRYQCGVKSEDQSKHVCSACGLNKRQSATKLVAKG